MDDKYERDAIVAWLRSEAAESKEYAEAFPDSGTAHMGLQRALYYDQAAGMIERGLQHYSKATLPNAPRT